MENKKEFEETENISYCMTAFDEILEDLDVAMTEVAHLLSIGQIVARPDLRRELFRIGEYLCEQRVLLEAEPNPGIRFGKLRVRK